VSLYVDSVPSFVPYSRTARGESERARRDHPRRRGRAAIGLQEIFIHLPERQGERSGLAKGEVQEEGGRAGGVERELLTHNLPFTSSPDDDDWFPSHLWRGVPKERRRLGPFVDWLGGRGSQAVS